MAHTLGRSILNGEPSGVVVLAVLSLCCCPCKSLVKCQGRLSAGCPLKSARPAYITGKVGTSRLTRMLQLQLCRTVSAQLDLWRKLQLCASHNETIRLCRQLIFAADQFATQTISHDELVTRTLANFSCCTNLTIMAQCQTQLFWTTPDLCALHQMSQIMLRSSLSS